MKKEYLFYDMSSYNGIIFIMSEIELYKPEKIIFFSQSEWELGNNIDYSIISKDMFEKKLSEYNIKLYIIFGSGNSIETFYKKNKTLLPIINTEIILWPMFCLYFSELLTRNYRNIVNNTDYVIDKLFISLNNRTHLHRCKLMDEIFHFELNNYGNFTWLNENDTYNFKYWSQEKIILDVFDSNFTIPDQYKTSLINLVSESTISVPFITEKTFMAILLNQPFIIYGSKGIHKLLTDHGFELYTEIFDYGFDDYDDDDDRLNSIINNLIKNKNCEYNDIRSILEPKIKRNSEHAFDIIKNKKYIPDLIIDVNLKYNEELKKFYYINFI